MNKSVFFLVSLIVIAFCSSTKVISYDSVLDKLVQMNQAVGKDKNDIGVLVSQVSQSLKDSADKFDAFVKDLNEGCKGGNTLLTNFLIKLEGDQLAIKSRSNKAAEENKKIVVQRDGRVAALKKTHEELKELHAQIEKEVENFKIFGSEAEQKLVIIKTLRDIITDELLGEQKGNSFVQLQTFNDKLRELKILLEKSHDGVYAPLVTSLLSLAEGKGFSDQKILGQILDVLGKLENNLKNFREKQNTDGKKNIKNLKAQAEEKVNQTKTLARMIADDNSNVADNENIIKASVRDLETLKKEVARKTQELNYWKSTCDYESELEKHAHAHRAAFEKKLKDVNTALLG